MDTRSSRTRVAVLAVAIAVAVSACVSGPAVGDTPPPASSGQLSPGDPIEGAKAYRNVCATCHGADLAGVEGLGGGLLPSAFIAERSDEELIDFIIEGRPVDHPDNITGVAMLPRGGNPALTDQDIANIVAYIKARQPTTSG